MADVITRLKIESGEYDSKIKRAVTGLQNMEQECRRVDGTLAILEKDQKQYVQSLGQMQTVSNTVRGKIGELSGAFVELRAQYNRLTEEEKRGDYGKALSKSLDDLKNRIRDSKKELSDIQQELNATGRESNSTGGILDQLSQKFTINFDAVKLFNTALKAADGAMQVAKDAFFASESTVDEWGRTVEASRSLYEGFLTALNNSDISGYLTRMDQIAEAARAAYNELDRLGTMKTIQGPAMSAQQAENDRMRQMIMTGRYIAPVDGRNAAPGMVNGQQLTAEQIRAIERNLQGGMQKIVTLVGNEVKQTSKAIDARYSLMAKENGMTLKEFRKGTSSMAEFDKRIKAAAEYEKYERAHTTTITRINPTSGDAETVILRDNTKNPYEAYKNWGTFRVDKMGEGSYNDLVNLIRQRDQQAAQAYSMQSQAYRTINRAEGTTVRDIMNGKTGSGGGTGGSKSGGTTTAKTEEKELTIQQQIAKLEKEALTATGERREAIAENIQYLDRQLEKQKELNNELHGRKTEEKDIARYDLDYASGGNSMGALAKFTSGLQAELQSADLGSDTFATLTEQLADANTMSQVLQQAMESGVKGADFSAIAEEMKTKLLQGGISEDQWQEFVDNINALIEDSDLKLKLQLDGDGKIEGVTNQTKAMVKEWNAAGQAISAVGSAMSQIGDPAAKVVGTIAQAIANVALAYSDAMAKDKTTKFNLFGFIAAASAATIGMISTIASIHSATGYAQGGIVDGSRGGFVGGSAFSGDQVGNVRLNSGELVLNRAQQGILASQLESASDGYRGTPQARISGEQIYLTLGAYLKRSGRGEILTSR